jgi:guanosine-3',5'-bis(diphosphate) 3'-pyrophosphohydrolase
LSVSERRSILAHERCPVIAASGPSKRKRAFRLSSGAGTPTHSGGALHPDPQALLLEAVAFAADKHRNQRRKDAEASPYINHPIALASLLKREGVDDAAVLCAALLHDTIEDTNTTADELRVHFGEVITSVVLEVTDDKTLQKAERKRLQIAHAHSLSERARLVKLADKICNVYDMVEAPPANWTLERKREYLVWAKEVVDRLRGTHAGLEAIFDEVHAKGVRALG